MPVTGSYLVETYRVGKLDSTIDPRPKQRLRVQRDAKSQGTHERRNCLPPRGVITSDQVAIWRHATQGQAQNQDPILVHRQAERYLSTNYQLSLGGACIRGSGLPECTACRDEQIELRCTQSQLPQR